jgi:hypothetical protein
LACKDETCRTVAAAEAPENRLKTGQCGATAKAVLLVHFFQMAFLMNQASHAAYVSVYVGTPLQSLLDVMRAQIMSPDYYHVCNKLASDVRYNNSLTWFNQMTTYMNSVKNIRTTLANETVESLRQLVEVEMRNQVGISVVM